MAPGPGCTVGWPGRNGLLCVSGPCCKSPAEAPGSTLAAGSWREHSLLGCQRWRPHVLLRVLLAPISSSSPAFSTVFCFTSLPAPPLGKPDQWDSLQPLWTLSSQWATVLLLLVLSGTSDPMSPPSPGVSHHCSPMVCKVLVAGTACLPETSKALCSGFRDHQLWPEVP